eukprot:scaffold3827_cov179-Cylindrotheca_fusiformis.AAC.45
MANAASGFQLVVKKSTSCRRLQTSCFMLLNSNSSSYHHSSQVFQSRSGSDEDDTGYCIPAAHGLICPETIANMEREASGRTANPVIQKFVETYHRHGPLACEDMLSDPEILPHLTRAMRDIA